jgi:hypothetical protein
MVSPSKIRAPAEPAIRAADAAFLGGGEGGGVRKRKSGSTAGLVEG